MTVFLSVILSVLILVHIFFFIALIKKKFDVIDIGWGLGIILATGMTYLYQPSSFKNALIFFCVTTWGLRLAFYVSRRNHGQKEDKRYAKFRQQWQPHPHLQAYFKVFLAQGFLMLVVSLPATVGIAKNAPLSLINTLGFIIWLMGIGFESWADLYLSWFKRQPENKGKICTTGPWRLCRFPNYFGEVLLWYGIYFLGFEWSSFWTIIGPLTINFMILKVTGVPLLEEHYKDRKDYEEYKKRVPRFIPFTPPMS